MKTLWMLALAAAIPQDAPPYTFGAPEGWSKERMTFPLGFARDLEYRGVEELRFAPGMFKPEAGDYWSYAFLMWLEGSVAFDAKTIERDLLKYYKGLCGAVGASRKLDLDLSKVAVKATKQEAKGKLGGEEAESFHATIDCYDAFVTGKPITLHLELWARAAEGGKRCCLFAIVSPKEKSATIWETLRKIQADFRCPK